MLPVKNEAWVLRHCLQSLSFCDEILAVDDNSTDETREILNEFNCTILDFNTATNTGWKEYEIRQFLLKEARARGATHLIAIDGDEMFSDAFVKNARTILCDLKEGESIALPWINVVDERHIYKPISQKIFAMRDDGLSVFREQFLHVPRVPTYRTGSDLHIPYAVLHFQYLNVVRNTYKQAWYMMSEYVKKNRTPLRINVLYDVYMKKNMYPLEQLIATPLPDPDADTSMWQKERIFGLFQEYGVQFFEPLNIWKISDLKAHFVSIVGREPKPKTVPRWILTVNNWKNSIRNLYRAHFS